MTFDNIISPYRRENQNFTRGYFNKGSPLLEFLVHHYFGIN